MMSTKQEEDEMSTVTGNGFTEGKNVSLKFTHPQNRIICIMSHFPQIYPANFTDYKIKQQQLVAGFCPKL